MSKIKMENLNGFLDLNITEEEYNSQKRNLSMMRHKASYVEYFYMVQKINKAFANGEIKPSVGAQILYDVDYAIFVRLFEDLKNAKNWRDYDKVMAKFRVATNYLKDKLEQSLKIKDGFVVKKAYVEDYLKPFFNKEFIEAYASNFNNKGVYEEVIYPKQKIMQ